jgi:hypothetical protein
MLTQFSKGNNMQDTAGSKLDDILLGDICVFSIQQNRPFFHKVNISPFENCDR